MFSLLLFVLVLSILIIVHEFGHFIMAKRVGVKVERFSLGFGPKLFSHRKGETEYLLCAVPLGGYVKLAGDEPEDFKGGPGEYLSKTPWQRVKIVFFGPALNYAAALVCLWIVFFFGYPTLTTKVGETIEGLGAEQAGIVKDDRIIAVDGKRVAYWDELQKIIHIKKDGDIVKLSVSRGNTVSDIEVRIKQRDIPGILGDSKSVGLIGVQPAEEIIKVRYGLLESLSRGTAKLLEFTLITYKAIWRIVTGRLSMRDSATGPLGIFYITSKAAELGFIAVIHLMAVLNVSLAIFNLLPLPVLDGGHIFLLIVEKLRGRRLSQKVDKAITQFGLSLIVLLALFVFYNDLVRFGVFERLGKFIGPR